MEGLIRRLILAKLRRGIESGNEGEDSEDGCCVRKCNGLRRTGGVAFALV